MKNFILYASIVLCLFSACSENDGPKVKKAITLGDPNSIVMEIDSQFLQNNTEDIAPASKKSSERQITEMMAQVDSMKTSHQLEKETTTPSQIRGFTINFKECSVVFNGLLAHALQLTQDERKSNSVSYLKDGGQMLEMNLQVTGLTEVEIEQRLYTKLFAEQGEESYTLNDLGKFTSTWYNLVGKDNRFVSVGSNSIEFTSVDHNKIKNALDRELRKKKKDRKQIDEWMKAIAHTQGYSDAPCKVKIVSAQWRIKGMKDGKHVQKLIQFDEPAS